MFSLFEGRDDSRPFFLMKKEACCDADSLIFLLIPFPWDVPWRRWPWRTPDASAPSGIPCRRAGKYPRGKPVRWQRSRPALLSCETMRACDTTWHGRTYRPRKNNHGIDHITYVSPLTASIPRLGFVRPRTACKSPPAGAAPRGCPAGQCALCPPQRFGRRGARSSAGGQS